MFYHPKRISYASEPYESCSAALEIDNIILKQDDKTENLQIIMEFMSNIDLNDKMRNIDKNFKALEKVLLDLKLIVGKEEVSRILGLMKLVTHKKDISLENLEFLRDFLVRFSKSLSAHQFSHY